MGSLFMLNIETMKLFPLEDTVWISNTEEKEDNDEKMEEVE
jgi:hypothetical protein